MKALFVYSGFIFKNGDRYFSLNLTTSTLHNLYFPFCNELTICERIRDIANLEGLSELSTNDIKVLCPNIDSSSIALYFTKKRQYYKYIEKIINDFDYVIARQGILGNYAAELARKHKIPYVYECVGSTFASFWNHGFWGKLLAIPLTISVRRNIKNSKYVTYVTEQYLQRLYPTKGHSVGVSDVEISNISESILNKRLRRISDLDFSEPLKMVTIGGVNVFAKGQQYAIKAVSELKKAGIVIDYYLIGEGNQERLRMLARKLGISAQIHFLGAVKHSEVFNILDNMDIYIQPSLQEGLPRAVVEAMSRGLICLGSKIAGIPELISENYLFYKKDVSKIVDILKSIDKSELRSQAISNFNRSKDFHYKVLREKRMSFWANFIKENFMI